MINIKNSDKGWLTDILNLHFPVQLPLNTDFTKPLAEGYNIQHSKNIQIISQR